MKFFFKRFRKVSAFYLKKTKKKLFLKKKKKKAVFKIKTKKLCLMTQFSWKVLASTSDFVHFFGAFSAEFFSLFFTYRVFQEMVLHPVNGSLRMCLSMYLSIYVYLEHLRLFQQLPHQMAA